MGGSQWIGDDWELAAGSTAVSTLVLLGCAGNGKSATGNSILGRKAFRSMASSSGVTTTSEMQYTTLDDGRVVNVIDTPGLFDLKYGPELISKEIVKCLDLAKDGIHAVLVVYSTRSRFTEQDYNALRSMQSFFGDKITDYMIVVYTGGDDLEDGRTLEDHLEDSCETLQKVLRLCNRRMVLFDNKTKDVNKQEAQVHELLSLVDSVIVANDGKPFSDQYITELKEGALRSYGKTQEVESLKKTEGYTEEQIFELKNQIHKSYDDKLEQLTTMVEEKLELTVERLEKQLANEQAAREEAVRGATEAQNRSSREIQELRDSLEAAKRESEEFRRLAQGGKCAIL